MKLLKHTLITVFIFTCGFLCGAYRQDIMRMTRTLFRPTVTVLMSTYNRGTIVSPAIESILNQSFTDFEFIIIDDGSTDHTADVIQSYADKDNRIIFLKNETNKGLIYSLNRGLDKARGTYIARMDDDDLSLPWRLSRQVAVMDAHPELIVLGAYITGVKTHVDPPQTPPLFENPDRVEIQSYANSALAHPTIIIRRDFLNKHGIRYKSDNLYAEDVGLYADVLNAGGKISQLTEPLLRLGVVKNLKRPNKYYDIQFQTFIKIQQEKLKPLLTLPKELAGPSLNKKDRCRFWFMMRDANKNKNVVNQKALEQLITERCPSSMFLENSLLTKHPYWEDFLIRENEKRLIRFSSQDAATIINETPDTLTLKWDNYGIETFKKDKNNLVFTNKK